MYDEHDDVWIELDEIPEELLEEYVLIIKEQDAVERELSLFLLAGTIGGIWYLLD
jgi:hypothetical protein